MENKNNKPINWNELSMQMIVEVGEAKSYAMEAIYEAKKGDFEKSKSNLKKAQIKIGTTGHLHLEVIKQEASGVHHDFKVLFMHAEDQFLNTQTLILLAQEICELYQKLK